MKKDMLYGRVTPIRGRNGRAIRGHVTISFWVADNYVPPYINPKQSYLQYEVEDDIVQIYNPMQLKFNLSNLISQIKTIYKLSDVEVQNIQIINPERKRV